MSLENLDGQDLSSKFEQDLRNSPEIVRKVQNYFYAQALYAGICQNEWIPKDVMQMLKGEGVIMSWRYVSGIMSRLRGCGDYMDFYCSGITDGCYSEGSITDEVMKDINDAGWILKSN